MRIPPAPHPWNLSPSAAIAVQSALARQVIQCRPDHPVRFVAGLDAAFSSDGRNCLAAVVVWDVAERVVTEQHVAARKLRFPYVPGLLSFREAPALLGALRKLRRRPDALMCDGQGVAHPRRFGIASHLGVICGLPSLGCAKSRLVGQHAEPAAARGSRAALFDREEQVGVVLRTQDGVQPVFVSVGHRFDLESACALVLACATAFRLPEPTRLADRLVAAAKRAAAPTPEGDKTSLP